MLYFLFITLLIFIFFSMRLNKKSPGFCFSPIKIEKMQISKTKLTVFCGLLTSLTVLFKLSNIFSPGIGIIVSPFAPLPIAMAAIFSPIGGIWTLTSSISIIAMFSLPLALVFLLSGGMMALTLGTGIYYSRSRLFLILISTLILTSGIALLLYVFNIPFFGASSKGFNPYLKFLFLGLYSLCYGWGWVFFIDIVVTKILRNIKNIYGRH